ncbi:hypothetical protein [Rhodococcus indonesiensis]|uniref:hypothetical protein n=1 Tax=Rhodococcus indonesiensis TaxID=3055869 RepID=UPI0039F6AE6B
MGEPAEPVDTGSTRQFETLFGTKTYHEVADLIAEPLRRLLDEVASGHFADEAMDVDLLREFHRRILIDVMPEHRRQVAQEAGPGGRPLSAGTHSCGPGDAGSCSTASPAGSTTAPATSSFNSKPSPTWRLRRCTCTPSRISTVERSG